MSVARTSTALTALMVASCLLLAGCADGVGNDTAASASVVTSQDGAVPGEEWTGEDMSAVIATTYEVAAGLWEATESFARTDEELGALADAVAAALPATVTTPVVDGAWSLTVYRGSYEGNGLTECSDGTLQVRVVVTDDGEAIGVGVADSTAAGRLVYDFSRVGTDPAFDLEGVATSAGDCTWTGNALAATEVERRDGRF